MDIPAISQAIEVCAAHLDATLTHGTEVEAYLVGYLLTLIYAEYEKKLSDIVIDKAKASGSAEITTYVGNTIGQVLRGIKLSEISGLLGKFDDKCKQGFSDSIKDTPAANSYSRLVSHRIDFAHRGVLQISFAELQAAYAESHIILDNFGVVLGVTST